MKILFVAYCFKAETGTQAMIGVYKRCLRVAFEAVKKNHDVYVYCTGREYYHDKLTDWAEQKITFIDIKGKGSYQRAVQRMLNKISPDIVVVGEAPLSGNFLITSQVCITKKIPLVLLDNAYSPEFSDNLIEDHQGFCDGMVLTGLSSFYSPSPPAHVCQVSPFIQPSKDNAKALLESLGVYGKPFIVILGYDGKTAHLGLSLLGSLKDNDVHALLLLRDIENQSADVRRLTKQYDRQLTLIAPPEDETLFGLIETANLVVAKYGFMQLTECLALKTPTLLSYHYGLPWFDFLPEQCRQFVEVSKSTQVTDHIQTFAKRCLSKKTSTTIVHNDSFDSAKRTVNFLEQVRLRTTNQEETFALGFSEIALINALEKLYGSKQIHIMTARASQVRRQPTVYEIFSLVCHAQVEFSNEWAQLWGRLYKSTADADRDHRRAMKPDSNRTVLYFNNEDRIMLELDQGEKWLPPPSA